MANIPDTLRYTKDHEWARLDGEEVVVGITDHAQASLGDVVYVELPETGDRIEAGEPFGTVESTKAVSELFAPISGEVVAVNDALVDASETVNSDPYGEAWMIRVRLDDAAEVEGLLDAAAYAHLVEEAS
jgi:glycine cleavage system H protein